MMATTFWNALKVSPALLGALFVANGAYAAESLSEREVAIASSEEIASIEEIAVSEPNSVEEIAVSELTVPEASLDLSQTESVIAQQVPAAGAPTDTSSEVLQQIERYSNEEYSNSLDQVTNVSQLSDVSPGDWAFEALRSLVERYGCIAGYPDGTYRGNRAMTRYEFAAGLNACLQQIESLIAGLDFVTREDLETLQRLIQEFEAELATLGTRVDNLEGRVAFLEDNQFSTTTKLDGEVVMATGVAFGDEKADGSGDDIEDNAILGYRVRLSLDTSFFGRDRLRTRLQGRFLENFDGNTTGTDMTEFNAGGTSGDSAGDVEIDDLYYRFPVGERFRVWLAANSVDFSDVADPTNPVFDSSGSGALNEYFSENPIVYDLPQDAGLGLNIGVTEAISVDLFYSVPSDVGNNPTEGNGLFNGAYGAGAQLNFGLGDNFDIALTYARSFSNDGEVVNLGGRRAAEPFKADPFADVDPLTSASADRFGAQANFRFGNINLGGWFGYAIAEAESGPFEDAQADIWNAAVTLAFLDFGGEGNVLGFLAGIPPKVSDIDDDPVGTLSEDDDTSFLVEAHYRFNLTDNILLTPGAYVVFNPEHNDDNDEIYVAILRATFSF